MIEEEIRLYASHNQFYVQDSQPRGSADDETFWTDEAFARRLATGDGLLAVGTGTYGFVKVRVEQHESRPALKLSQWDQITECGLDVRTPFLLVMGCLSSSGLFFQVSPAHIRVRVCHGNLAESEQEATQTSTDDYRDWYLVQFWPSKNKAVRILKQR